MQEIEQAVERLPGVAFAVDDKLYVVAWNRNAEEGLGLTAAKAVGRLCYEVVPAVDIETGRPCYEVCPLAQGSDQQGWAHNRVFESRWAGGRRTRLDCFFLQCVLPTSQKTTICFVEPPTRFQTEMHSRVLEAIEAIYPAISGPPDVKKTLTVSLDAVLRTTGADAGEVFLRDPNSEELLIVERRYLSAQLSKEPGDPLIGERFSSLVAHSEVPLLAIGPSGTNAEGGASGWYLCAPLIAEGRVLGTFSIASKRSDFNVAAAVRVLFPVAAQLGVYLQWAYVVGDDSRQEDRKTPGQAAVLQFRSLGAFRVFMNDQSIPATQFQRFKALTALKFLVAHRGRPVTREALIELLWPEADPTRAAANLRVVLHAVRRGLEPDPEKGQPSSFVLSQGDLVYLDPSERVWVDAEEFAERLRRGPSLAAQGRHEEAIAELRAAASLYEGDYMADDPYSDWCLFERERLRELYVTLLRQLATLLSQRGDVAGAVAAYRGALSAEAGREEIHRELMRLLWQAGLRDEALRQYEVCRRVLWDELEAEPSEATKAMYDAILRGGSPETRLFHN